MKGPRVYETPESAVWQGQKHSRQCVSIICRFLHPVRSLAQPLTVAVGTVSESRLKVVQLVFRIYTTTSLLKPILQGAREAKREEKIRWRSLRRDGCSYPALPSFIFHQRFIPWRDDTFLNESIQDGDTHPPILQTPVHTKDSKSQSRFTAPNANFYTTTTRRSPRILDNISTPPSPCQDRKSKSR